jgi:hypothetical protein
MVASLGRTGDPDVDESGNPLLGLALHAVQACKQDVSGVNQQKAAADD